MAYQEIFTDPTGKRWKIIILPDPTGGETILAVEIEEKR